jgi:transposase
MEKIKRPIVEVESASQTVLFIGMKTTNEQSRSVVHPREVVFKDPNPKYIYPGNQSIETHLQNAGIVTPGVIRDILEELDWSEFEKLYKPKGRRAYHPRLMMGIVLYGVTRGVTSLRGLEQLARTDLGCMWVGGGICPDHSILGRFINKHSKQITDEFFMLVTREVLERTGSDCESVAGDGTVVQAAASRYSQIKQEAALQAQLEASLAAKADPANAELQRKKEVADEVAETMQQRIEARKRKGKSTDYVKVSSTEPQAMVQPLKNSKQRAPSYKASILTNEKRVVVAAAVDPSSETKVVKPMLEDVKKLSGEMPKQGMFDAGYHCEDVIDTALDNDIDLLCPSGKTNSDGTAKEKPARYFPKSEFEYDEQTDSYRCPAGQQLSPIERNNGSARQPAYVRYGTHACTGCPLIDKCTRSPTGRKVKRYAIDEKKEALRQVMEQKGAQLRYIKRRSMAEPVFSDLRYRQGLMRFRRKGTRFVRLEFFLHVIAHNLRRAVAVVFALLLQLWYPVNLHPLSPPLGSGAGLPRRRGRVSAGRSPP